MVIRWFIHIGMLGLCSVEDWREKQISLWKIWLYAIVIVIYEIWCFLGGFLGGHKEISEWMIGVLTGILPGIGMLIMGKLSQEAIGYGDGYLTLILGFSMGFWEILGILGIALFGVFGVAVYLVVIRKRSRNSQIAFVPFLLLGMAGTALWNVR